MFLITVIQKIYIELFYQKQFGVIFVHLGVKTFSLYVKISMFKPDIFEIIITSWILLYTFNESSDDRNSIKSSKFSNFITFNIPLTMSVSMRKRDFILVKVQF